MGGCMSVVLSIKVSERDKIDFLKLVAHSKIKSYDEDTTITAGLVFKDMLNTYKEGYCDSKRKTTKSKDGAKDNKKVDCHSA
jgi:hypothetical protein